MKLFSNFTVNKCKNSDFGLIYFYDQVCLVLCHVSCDQSLLSNEATTCIKADFQLSFRVA